MVIAPEYRGSIGYGRELYEAIDYGGAEIDDVVIAVDVLTSKYTAVDRRRVAVIGWSHGGMIALLSAARNPGAVRRRGGAGSGHESVPPAGVERASSGSGS